MVSPRKLLAAISILLIIWLVLSLLLPPFLFPPIIRQDPYEEVPGLGSGVIVGTGDDWLILNDTLDEIQFRFNWTFDPTMTIAIVNQPGEPRYWRRNAYDTYNGTNWERSNFTTGTLDEVPPGGETRYTVWQNITHDYGGSFLLLSLWPDPMIIQNSIIYDEFVPSNPYNLTIDNYNNVILDGRFRNRSEGTIQYDVTFNNVSWTEKRPWAQSASNTPAALALYQTQGIDELSPATQANITSRLASILSGVPDNAFEEAYAILEYFKATFTFDPFLPRPGPVDEHVEWFLANEGGVGLDFATAYTMFLRMAGIAARPVLGGIFGEQQGSQRIIRLMHMHVWVEVYVPTSDAVGGYWLQYDPTPLPTWITGGERDPYVISTYYNLSVDVPTPIVDRGVPFQVRATLLRDGAPEPNQIIYFYDETENWLLGSDVTSGAGLATITFTYNDSAVVGFHLLRVAFQSKSEYGGIGLHGAANLSLTATPLEINRTFIIRFNGTLIDAVNGRGITSNETLGERVNILLNGEIATNALTSSQGRYLVNYRIPSSQDPLGTTFVNATFVMLGIIDPTASNTTILNITALSQLSLQATPNAARKDSNVTLSGQLRYDNSTGLPSRIVQLFWNGTPIGSAITDINGYYFYNHTANETGFVTVRAEFYGGGNIYGSIAVTTVRVHEEGTIVVFAEDSDGDQIVQRDASVVFTGWVEDQNGTRQGGVTVQIKFNLTIIVEDTTLPNGSFIIPYQVNTSLSVGYFEVTGDVVSGTLQVVSTVDYLTVNSTTQILSLQVNPTQAMVGEGINITGRLVDDQSAGIPSSVLNISLIYQTTIIPVGTVWTQSDGTFQILWTLPSGITVDTVSFEANYSGSAYYSSNASLRTLDVFSNATLDLQVNSGPHPANATITVNGTLMDNFNRPLPSREILLFFDNNTAGSLVTDVQGRVIFVLQLPMPSSLSNYTVQLRHETVIIISSSQEIVVVEAAPLIQEPITIPPELILLIVGIVIIIVVIVIVYRRRKRQPRITGSPSIDAAAMLTSLRQLLGDKKYRESIIYAFRMFEAIAQSRLGVFRDPSITLREFANLAVARGRLDTRNMAVFVRGVEEARFSDHPVSYNTALATLNAFANIYNHLTGGNLRFVTQEQEQSQ